MEPLTIYPKHPEADAYKVGSSYAPYALVARANRFTDAELAAECWKQAVSLALVEAAGEITHPTLARLETFKRFAKSEHFDGAS